VSDAARRLVEQFQTELPPGVSVDLLDDRSDMYRQRINLLLKNGRIGLVLVLILLGLFLEARLAFWVMMGIPISFLGGLLFLPSLGVTINMMSMFAFLIALGIVVDDAIVVGENVYEHHQQGMPFLKAAIVGTQEVAVPVTFSILTNLVTFFPLMVVPGVIGKIWRNIPMVVVTVFIISLLECMFILPSHLGHSGERGPRTRFGRGLHRQQQRFSRFFMHWVQNSYGPFLRKTLDHRYLTVSVGLGVLIVIIGCVKSARVGMIPFPRTEADASVVTAVLPYGTALSKSEQVRDRLVTSAQRVAERHGGKAQALGVFAEVGGAFRGVSGGHVVEVRAYMSDVDSRPVTTTEFTREWREEAGEIPGLEAIIFEADRGGPGSGAGLTLELSHPDSQTLELACSDLAVALEDYPTVSDIDDGYSPGKRQFDFRIRPETLNLGLTARDIALQMRGAFYGSEALRQQRGRNEVKVKVRLPEEERVSEQDINELLIRTPAGVDVPLREVAAIERGRAYTRIERRDGRRILNVSANVTPEYEAERIMEELRADTLPRLKERYPGLSFSFEGRQEFFREALQSLARGFLIAILVIYAMLAIPFGSYIQPLVVMICIPFGIVGAVIGHMLMGFPLSVVSMMGIVALAGVVVNDSLVLIDYANRQRDLGISMREAVHLAGVRRFRPILLTTLTTFFGLAPMIFETSRQARFMIPMAISLGYGILFATLITLVLVPSLVVIIEDFKHAGRAVADVVTPGDADAATGPEF
jgi:multidrug efflux pump subunit AcrB